MRIDYQNRPATRISMNFLHFVGLLMLFFFGGDASNEGFSTKKRAVSRNTYEILATHTLHEYVGV